MALFTYFDCESDAGAAQKATCLSVAAVTVDENFFSSLSSIKFL